MRLRFSVPLLATLLALPLAVRASDDEGVSNALSIAHSWLAEIDAGNYEQSYTEAGSALHDKVPKDRWLKILKVERQPLGKVAKREEFSHVLHTDGLEGANGTFLVVTYHTNFISKPDEVEYIVLRHEFGGWRCVGYDFGPANPQGTADTDNTPATTTTDQTLAPPTPTNGMVVPAQRTSSQ